MCWSVNWPVGQSTSPACMMQTPTLKGPWGIGRQVSLAPHPVPACAAVLLHDLPVDPQVEVGRTGAGALGAHELPVTVGSPAVAVTLQGLVPEPQNAPASAGWGPHPVPPKASNCPVVVGSGKLVQAPLMVMAPVQLPPWPQAESLRSSSGATQVPPDGLPHVHGHCVAAAPSWPLPEYASFGHAPLQVGAPACGPS